VFSPDGKLIVSASGDHTLKVWDAKAGRVRRTLAGHSDLVLSCAFSACGKLIISASGDRTLKVWDAQIGKSLTTFYTDGQIDCCAMHGDMIVAGGRHGVYLLRLVR
jgi:WD40 repeat protein